MVYIAIAVVCSILGYLLGLLSPCCLSKGPMDRWTAGTVGEEQARKFQEAVEIMREQQQSGCRSQKCKGGSCKAGGCARGCSIPPNSPHVPPKR